MKSDRPQGKWTSPKLAFAVKEGLSCQLFLGQPKHKDLNRLYTFRPEVFYALVGNIVDGRSVWIFLLKRQMALNHAHELTSGPRTIFDRLYRARLSRITIEIKYMRSNRIRSRRRQMHLVLVLYNRFKHRALVNVHVIAPAVRFSEEQYAALIHAIDNRPPARCRRNRRLARCPGYGGIAGPLARGWKSRKP